MKKRTTYLYTAFASLLVMAVGAKVAMHEYHAYKRQHATVRVENSELMVHQVAATTSATVHVLGMRKFPYPYDAMLAISSDADDETLRKFVLVHEFINTHEKTPFGYYGIGLPFADSVFMYNGSNLPQPVDYGHTPHSQEMSWFRGVSKQPFEAQQINEFIKWGWIDTLHSYGDFSRTNPHQTLFTRHLAAQAIAALRANGDMLTVWTDHGNQSNVDGFGKYGHGAFYNYQQGANPHSPYYHTDLTIPYGVRFVWPDGNSDIFGRTSMIYPLKLADGRTVWGFYRYTSSGYTSAGYPIWNWTVGDLSKQITPQKLALLERAHDYCILAQHLEALNTKLPLPPNTIDALWLLAKQYNERKLLVATTSQLLDYNVAQKYVHYHVTYSSGQAYIHIDSISDPVDGKYVPSLTAVRGMTFYTSNPAHTVIEIGNQPVPKSYIVINHSDGVAPSVEIRWFTWNPQNHVTSGTSPHTDSVAASVAHAAASGQL